MAHHKSAKKRIRRNERAQVVNKNRKSRIRSFIRKIDEAITSGDKTAADAAFKVAQPEIQRGVTKGIFHKNTVNRMLSRLSARIKKIAA